MFIVGSANDADITEPFPLFSDSDPELPRPVTVKDAIFGLPPIHPGGGKESIEFTPSSASPYQRFLADEISFDKFYSLHVEMAI